jgi:hypothetical protein
MTLYETVETAIGQAKRMSSRKGLSFQGRFMAQPAWDFGGTTKAKKNRESLSGPAAGFFSDGRG